MTGTVCRLQAAQKKLCRLITLLKNIALLGFMFVTCDGHEPKALCVALRTRVKNKPTVVIAETTKGKGISLMENKAEWHHGVLTEENYLEAKEEILKRLDGMKNE